MASPKPEEAPVMRKTGVGGGGGGSGDMVVEVRVMVVFKVGGWCSRYDGKGEGLGLECRWWL
jgi:hypothetical protein